MKRFIRVVIVVFVVVATLWLLFTVVFPWVESYMENPSISASLGPRHAGL
ncbi:MAG: hypothetical protein ABR592_02850 [Nitriliruptorales bacterium]